MYYPFFLNNLRRIPPTPSPGTIGHFLFHSQIFYNPPPSSPYKLSLLVASILSHRIPGYLIRSQISQSIPYSIL